MISRSPKSAANYYTHTNANMQLGFVAVFNTGSSLVPEMAYFHNKYTKELKKKSEIHLNLNTD